MATTLNQLLLTYASIPSGGVIQVVHQQFPNLATGTNIMPADDSVPTITEGIEFMSLSVTPKSASSILRVDAVIVCAYNVSHGNLPAAIFRVGSPDALAVVNLGHNANFAQVMPLMALAVAGTTSAVTFTVRAGSTDGNTITFNGTSSSRLFGGKSGSWMSITEVLA